MPAISFPLGCRSTACRTLAINYRNNSRAYGEVHPYRDHANLARGYSKPHPYITFLDSRASEPQNKISQGFTISTGRNAPLPSSMGLPHATLDRFRRLIRFSLVMLAALLFAAPVLAQAQSARLDCSSLFSAILGRDVAYCIALPPGYDQGTARYPVLYFLHGLFENEKSWSEHSGQQTWESLMSQGKIGKFIVVMPEGGKSFYVNSFDGKERYEDFFIQEFVPAIDRKYRTIAASRGPGNQRRLHGRLRRAAPWHAASGRFWFGQRSQRRADRENSPIPFPPRAAGDFTRGSCRHRLAIRSMMPISTPTIR